MFNIVLVEPQIPQNTGNIARTCAVTGSKLHIIKPMGFAIDDKKLKRAGLDYWHYLGVQYYESLDDFFAKHPDARCWYATTKALYKHTDAQYRDGDYLFFGREDAGLPETLLYENKEQCIRIPMMATLRSLNLSNSAAIVVYEALRQTGFEQLEEKGELHNLKWE